MRERNNQSTGLVSVRLLLLLLLKLRRNNRAGKSSRLSEYLRLNDDRTTGRQLLIVSALRPTDCHIHHRDVTVSCCTRVIFCFVAAPLNSLFYCVVNAVPSEIKERRPMNEVVAFSRFFFFFECTLSNASDRVLLTGVQRSIDARLTVL